MSSTIPETAPQPDPELTAGPHGPPTEPKRGPLRRLYHWVLSWAETRYGLPALALVSFTESSFFPIPPDPLLMALSVGKPKRALLYATVCSIASVLGGIFGYVIGMYFYELIGEPIVEFYHLAEKYQELGDAFQEAGFWAILGAALTPIPYKVFTIAAGAFKLSLATFIIASVVGRSLRFFAESVLIRIFGDSIRDFIEKRFNLVVTLFFILLVGGFFIIKMVL